MAIKLAKGCVGDEELAAVKSVFEYGYFGLAGRVDQFEDELKSYLGAGFVTAVNSGTNALHLVLEALGIKEGDEVIVPSLTFVASFQAISATGAKPVCCDVLPDTLLMDIEDVKKRITDRTKAIMPVHYSGNPCDMDALLEIKEVHRIRIVEDAAHAFGSLYKGRKIGSFGDVTCFSFDSLKNITCGEGGAITCNDKEFNDILIRKRLLGILRGGQTSSSWKERGWFYDVTDQGYRYHMSNINAAIGLAQLKKKDEFFKRRREICRKYQEALKNLKGLGGLAVNFDSVVPFIFVIRVFDGRRDELLNYLREREIESGVNYIPNHWHSFYRGEKFTLPETDRAAEEILSLPLHCGLSDEDIETVIESIFAFFGVPVKEHKGGYALAGAKLVGEVRDESIVVTGASSFVGFHLCKHFSKFGKVHAVISGDLRNYRGLKRDRLKSLDGIVKWEVCDIEDEGATRDLIKVVRPKVWINHAGYVLGYRGTQFNVAEATRLNIAPLHYIYEGLAEVDCRGVVVTGSSMEYSDSKEASVESELSAPNTAYGLSKLMETITACRCAEVFGIPTRVARLFIPYGVLDGSERLISYVVRMLRKEKEVKLTSPFLKRDFVYVENVVNAYQLLVDDLSRGGAEIFNVSTGKALFLETVVREVARKMGAQEKLLKFGARERRFGEPIISYGSCEKLCRILNWDPGDFGEGIEKLLAES